MHNIHSSLKEEWVKSFDFGQRRSTLISLGGTLAAITSLCFSIMNVLKTSLSPSLKGCCNPVSHGCNTLVQLGVTDSLLAMSIVKRIVTSDEDVSRISADGLAMVAAAADQFLGLLALRGAQVAKSHKRKTIKLDDFVQVIKQDKRLYSIGLKDVVPLVEAQMEILKRTAEAKANAKPAKDNSPNKADDAENVDPGGVDGGAQDKGPPAKRGRPAGEKKQKLEEVPKGQRIDSVPGLDDFMLEGVTLDILALGAMSPSMRSNRDVTIAG
eukprot:gene29002-32195_t